MGLLAKADHEEEGTVIIQGVPGNLVCQVPGSMLAVPNVVSIPIFAAMSGLQTGMDKSPSLNLEGELYKRLYGVTIIGLLKGGARSLS